MADKLQAGILSVAMVTAHPSNIGRDLGDLRDLAQSIGERGVLVPIVVERRGEKFRLRDGHRRLAAARMAGVTRTPALIHTEELGEADWLIESLDYNERRQGYSDEDKRRVALRLLELGVSKNAIAEAFGMPWSKVQRLVDPPKTGVAPGSAVVSTSAARASTVVSKKTMREFVDHCRELPSTANAAELLVMLRALLDGRPWRTPAEARASEEVPTP